MLEGWLLRCEALLSRAMLRGGDPRPLPSFVTRPCSESTAASCFDLFLAQWGRAE